MENVRNNKIIKKKYLQFFVSVLVSVLVLQITTIIDSIIVGTAIGTKEMSGVKASNPIINVVSVFVTLISVGSSMVISIALGKRDMKKANTTFTYGLFLCVGVGLIFTMVGFFFSDMIVSLVTSSQDVLPFAQEYTKIVLWAAPAMMLSTYLGYSLRSDGFSKLSMTLLISGGLINVCFDLIFILGFKLGVKGAAIATDMSFIGATLIGCVYFLYKKRNLHITNLFSKENGLKNISLVMLKNGYPSAARLLFTSISLIIANFIIGKYIGYMGIAVFSVISNVSLIGSAVFQSSGASMLPIMGVFYGEKDYKGISLLLRYVILFVLALVVVVILIAVIFAEYFFPLFGIKEVPENSGLVLRIFVCGMIFTAIDYILLYYYSTLQKSYLAITIPLLEQIVICAPMMIWLIPSMGLFGLDIAYIVSEAGTLLVTLCISYLVKRKKNYQNLLLLPKDKTNLLMDFTVLASNIEAAAVSESVGNIIISNGNNLHMIYKI